MGCDLLEKSYLCGIQNNRIWSGRLWSRVVICLKNRTFAVYKTTVQSVAQFHQMLWFAWKIVPLRYTKQQGRHRVNIQRGCDLLEKSYLCGIQNNCADASYFCRIVVICLKNRTFAVYKTTPMLSYDLERRCDLLEKSYLCGIQNNGTRRAIELDIVVICLKNRTFAVYKTTHHS